MGIIVGAASLALAVVCFAGVAWVAGPEIIKNGWTIPINGDETIVVRDGGRVIHTGRHVGLGHGGPAPALVSLYPPRRNLRRGPPCASGGGSALAGPAPLSGLRSRLTPQLQDSATKYAPTPTGYGLRHRAPRGAPAISKYRN